MRDLAEANPPPADGGAGAGGGMGAGGAVVAPGPQHPSQAAARYLEAIYYLSHEGEDVRPGRLAEWLGVSPPTVTVALQRLGRDGLIRMGGGRPVTLTPEGEQAAAGVVRRHRVVECWLTEELGFDWVTADAEAERVSYALSDVVLDRLYEKLGAPTTCPHGNEIPGSRRRGPDLVSLAELPPLHPARVARISELAEHDAPHILGLLDSEGLVPGAAVVLEPPSADAGVVTVDIGDRRVTLSAAVAASVWVEPIG